MKRNSSITFHAIQQPSVVELIIENVKQALIRGELHSGDRLPSETELAEQLGVGRSAVREAMKVLEAIGVVNIRRGDGTYIVEQASDALLSPLVFAVMLEAGMTTELFELRFLIQVGYTQLAAENATPEDFARIETAAQALEVYNSQERLDVDRATELDLAFHFAVMEATHNPLVIKIGRAVEELFFSSIQSALLSSLYWAHESHRRIIQAMHGGDPKDIREAVDFSLVRWKKIIQDE